MNLTENVGTAILKFLAVLSFKDKEPDSKYRFKWADFFCRFWKFDWIVKKMQSVAKHSFPIMQWVRFMQDGGLSKFISQKVLVQLVFIKLFKANLIF